MWASTNFTYIMLVYRLEDDSGYGPYRGYMSGEFWQVFKPWTKQFHDANAPYDDIYTNSQNTRNPDPWSDGKLGQSFSDRHPHWDGLNATLFGFESLQQLSDWFWFPGMPTQLGLLGFSVAVYEVPDDFVALGQKQLMFYATRAFKREAISLRDIPFPAPEILSKLLPQTYNISQLNQQAA